MVRNLGSFLGDHPLPRTEIIRVILPEDTIGAPKGATLERRGSSSSGCGKVGRVLLSTFPQPAGDLSRPQRSSTRNSKTSRHECESDQTCPIVPQYAHAGALGV